MSSVRLAARGAADPAVAKVFRLYEDTLHQRNAVDFDDMLSLTAALLRASEATRAKYAARWRHVLVDEFQDTNGVQYEVLKLLAADSVFVVGDADQAIYGWRGADIRNQQRLDADFGIIDGEELEAAPPTRHHRQAALRLQAAWTRRAAWAGLRRHWGPPPPPPPVLRQRGPCAPPGALQA